MKPKSYVPDRGDIIWLEFDPQIVHEQRGRRPAVILSPVLYNQKTGLAILVPVTSRIKGYPFEVTIAGKKIKGAALSDQVKNLDWKVRNAEFIEKVSNNVLNEIIENIGMLIHD